MHGGIRQWCVSFPGAFECYPFGPETAVFKVQASSSSVAKVFALLWVDESGLRLNLKCDPALAEQLRESYPEVLPGYHMNKRHWNSVVLPSTWREGDSALQVQQIRDMIEDSYDLVASALPKRDQMLLGWVNQG